MKTASPAESGASGVLDVFSSPVRAWFASSFPEPTAAQRLGWPPIADGDDTLICAPTGSGKTLAAFLWSIDRIVTAPPPPPGSATRLVYVSPLRALAFDVEKNLRAPIAGIGLAADRLGVEFREPIVGMRTGDTPARERAALRRRPPDILITTPESLYLMMTSSVRDTLRSVEAVIVDEIHSLATTKRGAHLMVTLERLEAFAETRPQRIGLSATQRPLDEVARFLSGYSAPMQPRPVRIVDAGIRKPLEIDVVVPVEDMGDLGQGAPAPLSSSGLTDPARRSIWPAVHPKILELVLAHRSTIIFCNARRLAERLAARLNELAIETGACPDDGRDLVRAHHGSLAREQRVQIEDQLKAGKLRALVATSSLELGIDMGAVDLVIQVESPGAVSRGLQRIGRAGHSVGEPSKGTLFPKHRGDLVEAAVVVQRMKQGLIESTRYLRNPLDVLAQQIVAMVAMDEWAVDELAALLRRSATFADLTDHVFTSVLDLLAGRYPSEEFNELRPRVVWDRVGGQLRARDGAKRLAVTSGGTIPDRGLFGVFLPDGTRVGELDEEMVYESRPGETFLLGASTWRIEEITFERVVVTPAPGQPGKMPFWRGDRPGRPLELGQALGAFTRELRALPRDVALARLRRDYGLDEWAAANVIGYFDDQVEAGSVVPDDRTVVVERFRDEIGDWRVCLLTPFGTPVHAPWAMAIEARLVQRFGLPVETMWSDDGIVLRLPESIDELPVDVFAIDPDEIEELVTSILPSTSLFAARFRECAARALILPRRRPDKRTPLWQQRQRAADLLAVAARYPTFPILLEAGRECLQDVFDVPALRSVLTDLRSRRVRVVTTETAKASPFAQSLLFNWIATYMYEGDAPLAERRAAALSLDRDLLRELLGAEELRELLDGDVLVAVELELQRLADTRRAGSADELHDVLRTIGDLDRDELAARSKAGAPVESWLDELCAQRRAIPVRVAGLERIAAAEDAARLRDALGVALPLGLPAAFTDPAPHPLRELVARFARTHGPFVAEDVARRFGASTERVAAALGDLERDGRVVHGEFRPGGVTREWCDVNVLRAIRRRSLARLRKEVEPVEPQVLARFLGEWHAIGAPRRGLEALVDTVGLLQGAAIPASVLESDVLPARLAGYRPAELDALCASGDLVWVGAGALGPADGRLVLAFRDQARLLVESRASEQPDGRWHDVLRERLRSRGASFWADLAGAAPGAPTDELLSALWDLVWGGEVTNDTLTALRSFLPGRRARATAPSRNRRLGRPGALSRSGPPAGAGRWSLVADLLAPAPSPSEVAYASAQQLLERHGVVTREAVLAEGLSGGFSGVYPVLRALEERGAVRRGYFVAGLGAAQFALPGAVDRLRACREPGGAAPVALAATDPAQPYGAALSWPESAGRPSRSAGAVVVLADGAPLAYLERAGHQLLTFPGAVDDHRFIDAVAALVKDGRRRSLEIRSIDGVAVAESPWAVALREAGFAGGYRGLILRS